MDNGVYGAKGMSSVTGAPPLAVIPHLASGAEEKSNVKRNLLFIAMIVIGSIVAMAAVHFLYKPLDVLWFTGARKLGM
jgi:hypothetical protein